MDETFGTIREFFMKVGRGSGMSGERRHDGGHRNDRNGEEDEPGADVDIASFHRVECLFTPLPCRGVRRNRFSCWVAGLKCNFCATVLPLTHLVVRFDERLRSVLIIH